MDSNQIEFGVYEIPIRLADSLEAQRDLYRTTWIAAQKRLMNFAQKYGWEACVEEPFAREFHVYAAKAGFDRELLELCGLEAATELPSTYCAALEQGILMSVSPQLYQSLYPEGDEACAFEKLLAHELAHRLHIRILDGEEARMGPIWFYEGFALFAAGQFENDPPAVNTAGLWDILNDPERGSYRRYASVFRYFLGQASIQQLVEMAGKVEFLDWLKKSHG